MCLEVGKARRGERINVGDQANQKCNAAEGDEYPTDDSD